MSSVIVLVDVVVVAVGVVCTTVSLDIVVVDRVVVLIVGMEVIVVNVVFKMVLMLNSTTLEPKSLLALQKTFTLEVILKVTTL